MPIELSIRSNIKDLEKKLSALAFKQLPFATASALNEIGGLIKKAEQAEMSKVFDRPTPFTLNSIGLSRARKDNLVATVFVKDIAAAYLEPFKDGGTHKLIGRGKTWLNPKNVALNQYGNLAKSKLKQLEARADVFVGAVQGKSGQKVNGVWQRIPARKGQPAHLKLIVRFGDAIPVKQRLPWGATAQQIVDRNFNRVMGKALAKALATAR